MSLVKTRVLRVAFAAALALMAFGAAPADARTDVESYETHCETLSRAAAPVTRTCTYTFQHTDHMETFVVPPTVGPVRITAVGAPGGEPRLRSRGAVVTGSFSIPSGTPLFIFVGGDGFYGGYNGGGGGLGGGGGASDVRRGLPDLQHRIIVAGGGGGLGEQLIFDQEGGFFGLVLVRGGDAGQPGVGSGGQPGTAVAGGLGGGHGPARGKAGALGAGGDGANDGGGGGGGGLFGGGGGGGCSGSDARGSLCLDSEPGSGGGGSSLVPEGGTFTLSTVFEPSVTITVTQYG